MGGRFASDVLAPDPARRRILLDVLDAALDAVDPAAVTAAALTRSRRGITVCGEQVPAPDGVTVLALGKAAPAMAAAAVDALGDLMAEGVAASVTGAGPAGLAAFRGGHPIPDEGSVAAGEALLAAAGRAGRAGAGRVVLVLISGGGSALAEVPWPGLTLDDLMFTTDALLRSGVDITRVNAVRKHCSALKGGRLAAAAAPARLVTLAISDVVGSPLDAIASGPTVADPTTFADALAVASTVQAAPAVLEHLRSGAAGAVPESPAHVPGSVFVIADGGTAARAAAQAAAAQGIEAGVVGTGLTGSARSVGAQVANAARSLSRPGMLVWAGETTVAVVGRGRGGRNQELALAAGMVLEGDDRVAVASFGTDGIDGPTDAAGGIGDGGTVGRGRSSGHDAGRALDDNDAYTFLQASGDLLVTGPTGTNVVDLVIAWRS
jgi:glycerate-2-kinase